MNEWTSKQVKSYNKALEYESESQQEFSFTLQINDLVISALGKNQPIRHTCAKLQSSWSMGTEKKERQGRILDSFPVLVQVLSCVLRFKEESLWGSCTHMECWNGLAWPPTAPNVLNEADNRGKSIDK